MNFRYRLLPLAALLGFFLAASCDAQVFGGRVFANRFQGSLQAVPHPGGWHPVWQAGHRRAPTYDEYYHFMNSRAPKYYGGFHASYFQSMGLPTGDIGFRGNGIFQTPW